MNEALLNYLILERILISNKLVHLHFSGSSIWPCHVYIIYDNINTCHYFFVDLKLLTNMNGLYEKWKYATIILMGCGAAFSVSSLFFAATSKISHIIMIIFNSMKSHMPILGMWMCLPVLIPVISHVCRWHFINALSWSEEWKFLLWLPINTARYIFLVYWLPSHL